MPAAVAVSEIGGPDVLELRDVETREPGPGEAVVEVAAAGVNFIDIYERSGVYPMSVPFTCGSEGSGRVTAVGEGVDGVRAGDRVAWCDLKGSYAAAVVGPADRLIPVPDDVSDHAAAALPLQGLTAHYLVTSSYPLGAGDTVLLHAGAGGVGLLLTQIAKIKGARVITTVSTQDKATLSKEAGADEVLVGYSDLADRVREVTDGHGVSVVYDGVGKDTFDDSLASLRRRGMLVLFGGASGQVPPFDLQRLNRAGSQTVTRPKLGDFTVTREELLWRAGELFDWIEAGQLEVRVGATYPLAEAGQAQEDLAARTTTAKLLLLP